MEKTPQQRALDILEASLDLPEPERLRLLDQAAHDDPAVAAELQRLENVLTAAPNLLPTVPGIALEAATAAAPPEQIGPFKLLDLVGRGGMGSVYRAQRNDGLFEQQVAIKLLNRRRWSQDIERLFADERRILARLEHRNIARLYDGGIASAGQSYFVMEYVDGIPITAHCQQRGLTLHARIELLGQLCGALQFAHQQLVVHADIKPSNVLVTVDGSVKLLDFGIAQLVDRAPKLGAESTGSSPPPMTAGFAAPERVAGGPPTVAGDVYSLGVLLRELLNEAANKEPVSADLTAIVAKACAEQADARYGSVSDFDQDLRRWLRHLPVQAMRTASWPYRAKLFVARNRVAVAIGAVTLLGLSTATIVSTRLYLDAERARNAEAQRSIEIRELNTFITRDLSDQMINRPGMAESAWQTLVTTRTRLEALAASKPDDVRVQIELGRSIARIGYNLLDSRPRQLNIGAIHADLIKAENRLRNLETNGRNLAEYWEVRSEFATLNLINAFRIDGQIAPAGEFAVEASALAARALQLNRNSADALAAALQARLNFASTQNADGKPHDAIATLNSVISQIAKTFGDQPIEYPRLLMVTTRAAFLRCDVMRWSANATQALEQCRLAERLYRDAIRRKGPLLEYEAGLAYTLFLIATLLPAPMQSVQALALLDEAREIDKRILHFGAHQRIAGEVLIIEAARANTQASLGRFAEARETAALLLNERRKRLAEMPAEHARQREVATALRRVGEVEMMARQPLAACRAFREAGAIWDRMQRDGVILGFDLSEPSGQVPWIRNQLARCR
jgi:serine/threonine protein kinase